jgi:hypothetical protein
VTGQTTQVPALGPDERRELEQLRTEVARLRAEREGLGPAGHGTDGDGRDGDAVPPRRRGLGRAAGATVLVLLAVVLVPLSVVSVWARAEVTDTDRYVETVAPLADDPAVQNAIAANITDEVFRYIDVQGLTTQAFTALAERGSLPPALATQLQALAVPLSNAVRGFAEDQVLNAVRSDVFADAWEEANRAAHQELVAALTGEGETSVRLENNAVKVDMAAFVGVVKQRLVSSGFQLAERIPAVDVEFTVFQSEDVGKVQTGFRLLNTLGFWLPFVCVLLAGAGIYLARDHRRAFIGAGIGLALAMLVTGAALALARRAYLDGIPATVLPPDAAAVLFDTLVRFLRDAIRAGFLVGLLAAIGGFLAGPSVTAVALRRVTDAVFAAAKGGLVALGLDLGPVTARVSPHARALKAAVLVAAFLIVLLQRYRTPEFVVWVVVGTLAALAIVKFLAITPRPSRERPAGEAPVGAEPVTVPGPTLAPS